MVSIMEATAQTRCSSDPMVPMPYRITRIIPETSDTFTCELSSVDGTPMTFLPGQFNMLYVFGVGEIPISISGDPGAPDVLVHTTRAVGAVTGALSRLVVGDVIGVRGPFGTPWPLDIARTQNLVIIAGGIGLAPLRPVIYSALADRSAFDRISLLYGARTPEDMLYADELREWGGRFDIEAYTTVDRSTGDWRGNVGVVTHLVPHAPCDPHKTIAMVCGPEIMMRFAVMALQARGVANESIHVSMERNMQCAVGFCGHCQFGPEFVCKDGPVFAYPRVERLLGQKEA